MCNRPETPELDRLRLVQDDSHAIGEFLDFSGYILAERDEFDRLRPSDKTIQSILADYFDIGLNKVEQEKRALLKEWCP